MMTRHRRVSGIVVFLTAATVLVAASTRLVILHTNDIHDHVRPPKDREVNAQ